MNDKERGKKFQSKADTLRFLKQKLKKGYIEEIISFSVENWKSGKKSIIEKILDKFYPNEIIIRSSATGEDSIESTEAGKYKSIQKISTYSKKNIEKSINEVINSYKSKGNENDENQVLIQRQTTGVITNGVVFTSTPENGSPYYVINFSDSKDTDNVTKGETSNLVKIFHGCNKKIIPQKWIKLIQVLNEIEKIFDSKFLDIEFGITNENVVIFQVRPLTTIKVKNEIPDLERKILDIIKKNKKKYQKLGLNEISYNSNLIFSDMADWNPAEIIGNNPNPLDYSLYDFLIMKHSWQKGRTRIGYNESSQKKLMEKFGNKPYVNITKSFLSLIPENFSDKLKKKLLKFYLKKLEDNPELHDKVEFDILFSCYDFSFDDRTNELKKYGFKSKEINELKKGLIKFTNKILIDFQDLKTKCIDDFQQMEKNRNDIKKRFLKNDSKITSDLKLTTKLLEDCIKYGTINFSTMARIAFIGNILLKSLQRKNLVDEKFVNQLMHSISSPLSEIQNDLEALHKKKISKQTFLDKYGHLRPGTYDITAERYDENKNFLENIKFLTKVDSKKEKLSNNIMKNLLEKNGILLSEKEFLDFIKDVIKLREVLKFEFTKNLSDALFFISKIGNDLGFTRKEMAFLKINDIIFSNKNTNTEIRKNWKEKIIKNKIVHEINEFLILPPLIFNEKDFEIINYNLSQPNFITTKKITSEIEKIVNLENKDFSQKIIVIENADPGYDWIFTKNPSGLITKYGGVASHMAIRCAELGLPAAIGVGEIIFERIEKAKKILLDCDNKQIIILEHLENDPDIEVKKILKSLGYIK